jgi:hypothetical protein
MEKDAAGFPPGLTNPGISRYLAVRLPYFQSGSEGGGGNGAVRQPRRPPTLLGFRGWKGLAPTPGLAVTLDQPSHEGTQEADGDAREAESGTHAPWAVGFGEIGDQYVQDHHR